MTIAKFGPVLLVALFLAHAPDAFGNGRDWTIATLDSEGDVGRHVAMVLDPSGLLQIAYLREDTGDLRIISGSPDTWDGPFVVDQPGLAAGPCDVAANQANR